MTTPIETRTVLDRILARTAADLIERKDREPLADLERRALDVPVRGSLLTAVTSPGISVIAEFKRASPSKGRFPVDLEPGAVAAEYMAGGASAMSILTDAPFFQGSLADLSAAAEVAHRHSASMAILRKDFVIDEYQILEARAAGADAVLLIVAALDDQSLTMLLDFAEQVGMDALVEVHDEAELSRAEVVGARIIGVNNRDLRSFTVDLTVTERLAAVRSTNVAFVSESGIFTRADVERIERAGVDAVLIGESLMLAPNRPNAIRQLRGEGTG